MRASLCSPLLQGVIFQSRKGVGSTRAFPWVLKPPGIKLARRPKPPTKYWAILPRTTQYDFVLYKTMLRLTDAHKHFGRLGPGSGMRASLCSPLLKNAIFQSHKGVGSTRAFPWVLKLPGIKLARRPRPPTKYWAVLLFNIQG